MTEKEWLASTNPEEMYAFLHDSSVLHAGRSWFTILRRPQPVVSERKLRLFACVCCRRIFDLIPTEASCECLFTTERFAEGLATADELEQSIQASMTACDERRWRVSGLNACDAVLRHTINAIGRVHRSESSGRSGVLGACRAARSMAQCLAAWHRGQREGQIREHTFDPYDPEFIAVVAEEERAQADLLRHILGNPFRPYPAPPALPAAVVQLAVALEAGEPVAFALRDALLEAGQTELAEHFGGDEPHPRGCWALDVIGGRA